MRVWGLWAYAANKKETKEQRYPESKFQRRPCSRASRVAAARWDRISREVAPLRVATARYIMVQRTLLGRGVSTPKWCHHAALECLELRSVGSLLPRTSENLPFFPRLYEKWFSEGISLL